MIAVRWRGRERTRTFERKRLDCRGWVRRAAETAELSGSISAARLEVHGFEAGLPDCRILTNDVLERGCTAYSQAGGFLLVRREPGKAAPGPILPRHEAAALLGSVLAPAAFFVAGMVTHRFIFFTRYGLLCVIGIACASAIVMYRATAGSYRAGMAILAVMVAWLALARGREALSISREPETELASDKPLLIDALALGRPVVATEPLTFMAADFTFPRTRRGTSYYVTAERATARKYLGQDLAII